ncbi:MAG TPA: two-component regulator propeller domain-containing protein, partial [Chthonomonadales bacterium]|nr:two-component regulator propeller domain-containing protein [Chthonomonadales bacterium]
MRYMDSAFLIMLLALCLAIVRQSRADAPTYNHTLAVRPFRQDISHIFTSADGLPNAPILNLILAQGVPIAMSSHGNMRFNGKSWQPYGLTPAENARMTGPPVPKTVMEMGIHVNAVRSDAAGALWIASSSGLYRFARGRVEKVPEGGIGKLLSRNVQCVAVDEAGQVWLGTDRGVNIYRAGKWHGITGGDGLPVLDVRCITHGPDGSVWFGTARGAARLSDGKWRYYAGRRWLPNDQVNAIAVAENGDAWIATDGGVAHIEYRPMTFAEKAAHYEEITA